jgi:hypothetical protein
LHGRLNLHCWQLRCLHRHSIVITVVLVIVVQVLKLIATAIHFVPRTRCHPFSLLWPDLENATTTTIIIIISIIIIIDIIVITIIVVIIAITVTDINRVTPN